MSVIVICNWNPYRLFNSDLKRTVIDLGFRLIVMYASNFDDNSTLTFDPSDIHYCEVLKYSIPIMETTIKQIENINDLKAIIPYTEDDVTCAEYLANLFQLPCNSLKYAEHRRNKYLMQERIKEVGLRGISQQLCISEKDVAEFVANNNNIKKYVIKPVNSCASDDVYLCSTVDELIYKFNAIIGKPNTCNIINEAVLVQEFIDGDEYVINTVSCNGIHKIVSVYKYLKVFINDRHFIYFEDTLVDMRSIDYSLIIYALNVLNTLEISNGSGHAEIKLDQNGNPCLIEIGARAGGGQSIKQLNKCIGYSQLEVNLYAYLNPHKFNDIPCIYKTSSRGYTVSVSSYVDNIVWKDIYWEELILKLNTVIDKHLLIKNGDMMNKTIDLLSCIGYIFLESKSEEDIRKDIEIIRNWEQELLEKIKVFHNYYFQD